LKVTLPPGRASVGAFSLAVCAASGACSNASQRQAFAVNAPRVAWVLGRAEEARAGEAALQERLLRQVTPPGSTCGLAAA
jgi:hypothetical protein